MSESKTWREALASACLQHSLFILCGTVSSLDVYIHFGKINILFSIHTAIQCSPLPAITNGVITYATDITSNYDLGTVATYTCDDGFVLDLSLGGSMTRTCFDDLDNDAEGVFNRQAPRCIRK